MQLDLAITMFNICSLSPRIVRRLYTVHDIGEHRLQMNCALVHRGIVL